MTEALQRENLESDLEEKISLSHEEIKRYSRHLIMPEVGMKGQKKLKAAKVLIIGTGGLGSPLAMYLAAAGVGKIGIVDHDTVDKTNLQRQIIHSEGDVGRSKLNSATETINGINSFTKVVEHDSLLDSSNAMDIIDQYDIIVDCTDNFPTRYLTNDASVFLDKPYVYASIFRFEGQVSVFNYEDGPCYRCLYREPPPPGLVPSCAEGGVLGVLPGIMGTIQANEVIKIILDKGEPLSGRLLLLEALDMEFKTLDVKKNPDCPVCSDDPKITELIDYEEFCGSPIGEEDDAVPMFDPESNITVGELEQLIEADEDIQIIDVREPHEQEISQIDNSILIPIGDLEENFDKIDEDKLTIIHCKTGVRSAKATKTLLDHGFENVKNLYGGINAYAKEVDTSIPIY